MLPSPIESSVDHVAGKGNGHGVAYAYMSIISASYIVMGDPQLNSEPISVGNE
jgi:hypothetical protein